MPRYDYKCTECETEFELVQSFKEAGSGVCPLCSGVGRRVFHAVPVIYKGSGFYTTDYGRPKRPPENGSKDTPDGKSSTSEGSSSGTSASSKDSDSSTNGSSGSGRESTAPASTEASST